MKPSAALCLLILLFSAAALSALGGADVRMDVPWYGQTESSWKNKALGDSETLTIGSDGCALSATAMVLKYYGVRTNPGTLNKRLLRDEAYEQGWDDHNGSYLGHVRLLWQKAASGVEELGGFESYDYRDRAADLPLLRSYLDRNIPVIAEVLRPGGIPHFIVIIGYRGEDFLIRDPLDRSVKYLSRSYNISDASGSGAARNLLGYRIFLPAESSES